MSLFYMQALQMTIEINENLRQLVIKKYGILATKNMTMMH